jgi:hypothetical protein
MVQTLIRPGSNVRVSAMDVRGGDPVATDTVFMPVITRRGPVGEPVEAVDMVGMADAYGERDNYVLPHDCTEAAFALGASRVVMSRVVGPDAEVATVTLNSAATPAVQIDAASPGEWGNDLDVAIVAGSSAELVTYVVRYLDVEVQRFIDQASVAEFVAASAGSQWVRGVDLAGPGQPDVTAATDLTGGLADEDNITLAEVRAALDAMPADLGRGQVLAPAWTTIAAAEMLLEHAADTNRVALVGAPRSEVYDASVTTSWAGTVEALEEYFYDGVDISRLGAFYGQWADMRPLSGTVARSVPWTVVVAGLTARQDRLGQGINVQPIEEAGKVPASVITAAVPAVTDLERTALYPDRVNVAYATRTDGLRNYGYQSVTADPRWRQFNFSRYAMSLAARLDVRAKQQLGGAPGRVTRATLQTFGAILSAELLADFEAEEIFGDTPEDAYTVDTGTTVNTIDTINAGDKRARVEVAMTPSGETVVIDLIKRPIT